MFRLTWRQARPNLVSSAVLLLALAVFAVLGERAMSADLNSSGLAGCLAGNGDCDRLTNDFLDKYDSIIKTYQWMNLVPMLLGLFWGGPLVARELEHGTHRLAWTQSVGRTRWLTVRFAVYTLGAIAVAGILTWLFTWGLSPIAHIAGDQGMDSYSRVNQNVFDFEGIAPIAYTLFAFALGAAAGAVTRRVMPAMAVTLAVYLPFRLTMQSLRGHLVAPSTVDYPVGSSNPRNGLGDWIVSQVTLDPHGIATDNVPAVPGCDPRTGSSCIPPGYTYHVTYQPLSHFWQLQLAESGIFLGAAALCLAVTVFWTLRRVS